MSQQNNGSNAIPPPARPGPYDIPRSSASDGPNSSSNGPSSTTSEVKDRESLWYFSAEQLANSPSRRNNIDSDTELSFRQMTAYLIQEMGQRLQVSQLCINTAIVYMHRFYAFHSFSNFHRNGIAAASLFLAAKVEEQPRKLEHVIRAGCKCLNHPVPSTSDAYYLEQAQDLVFNENVLLQTLGFDVAIDHPHTHVVKTCHLVKACKDLAQTSYFLASNSLHLTSMCLQYKPTVVACFCIYLACKWSRWEIPQSTEGKHWFHYVDKTVTMELLKQLTDEFIAIYEKSPARLKSKLNSIKALAQGAGSRAIKDKKPEGDWKMGDMMKMYHSSIITHDNLGAVQTAPFDQQQPPPQQPPQHAHPHSQSHQQRKSEMHSSQHRSHISSSSNSYMKNMFNSSDVTDHKNGHKQQSYGSGHMSRPTRDHSQSSQNHLSMQSGGNTTATSRSNSISVSSSRTAAGLVGQNGQRQTTHPVDINYQKPRDRSNPPPATGHGVPTHSGHKIGQKQEPPSRSLLKESSSSSRLTDQTKQGHSKMYSSSSSGNSTSMNVPPYMNVSSQSNAKMDSQSGHDMSRKMDQQSNHDMSRKMDSQSGHEMSRKMDSQPGHDISRKLDSLSSHDISRKMDTQSSHDVSRKMESQTGHDLSRNMLHVPMQRSYSASNNNNNAVTNIPPSVNYHQSSGSRANRMSVHLPTQTTTQSSQHHKQPLMPEGLYGAGNHAETQNQNSSVPYNTNPRNVDPMQPEEHIAMAAQSQTQLHSTKSSSTAVVSSIFSPESTMEKFQVPQTSSSYVGSSAESFNYKIPKINSPRRDSEPTHKKEKVRIAHVPADPNRQIKTTAYKKLDPSNGNTSHEHTVSHKRSSHADSKLEEGEIVQESKIRRLDVPSSSLSAVHDTKSIANDKMQVVNGIETNADMVRNLLKESLCTTGGLIKTDSLTTPTLYPPAELLEPTAAIVTVTTTPTVYKSNVEPPAVDQSLPPAVVADESGSSSGKSEKKKKKEKHKHKDKDKSKDREERKKTKKDKDRHRDKDRETDNIPNVTEPVKIKISKEKIEGAIVTQGEAPFGFKIKIPKERISDLNSSTTSGSSVSYVSKTTSDTTGTPNAPPALKIKISKDRVENVISGTSMSSSLYSHSNAPSSSTSYMSSYSSGYTMSNPVSSSDTSTSHSKKKDRKKDKTRVDKREEHSSKKRSTSSIISSTSVSNLNGNLLTISNAVSNPSNNVANSSTSKSSSKSKEVCSF